MTRTTGRAAMRAPHSAHSGGVTAAAAPAATTAAAAATTASCCKSHARAEFFLFVEDIKSPQADVEDLFLCEKNSRSGVW